MTRSWDPALVDHVRPGLGADAVALLLARPPAADPWEHATSPEEQALEAWILGLAPFGRAAWTTAAAAAARHAYAIAIGRADPDAGLPLHEDAEADDGESAGMQLRRVEAWLADPTEETAEAVENAVELSRQLSIWDEDLTPSEDDAWWWLLEVGQLCAMAATKPEDGDPDVTVEPYAWPAPLAAARCAVCALKAIRVPGGDVTADLAGLAAAIARAFA